MNSSETIVQFDLFPDSNNNELLSKEEMYEYVELIMAHYSKFIDENEYIFYKDSFNLEPKLGSRPSRFIGYMNCGLSVQDEWYTVKLLKHLTRAIQGLAASISDEDGSFLMIEAAHHLPKWLDPSNIDNRVWIYNGDIHLLNGDRDGDMTMKEMTALDILRDDLSPTKATSKINQMITNRCEETIAEHFHTCTVTIPAKLGYILSQYPQVLSAVIHALDDSTDNEKKVRFSRLLYATVSHIDMKPSRMSGFKTNKRDQDHGYYIGMLLAMGGELLCNRVTDEKRTPGGDEATKCFQRFKDKLTEIGYFQGEIEGSRMWTKLNNKAREFLNSTLPTTSKNTTARFLLEICSNTDCKVEYMKSLPPRPQDDDDWLTITDQKLLESFKSYDEKRLTHDNGATDVEVLLQRKSDYDGITINDNKKKDESNDEDDTINLHSFDNMINDMKDFLEIPADVSSDSSTDLDDMYDSDEINEFGKMMDMMDSELKNKLRQPEMSTTNPGSENDFTLHNNMVSRANLANSLRIQRGSAGPVSTLLSSVNLEEDVAEVD